MGAGAIQIILPDWAPIRLPEAIDFLNGCAGVSGDIGLVLYNPPHAKTNLTPSDFRTIKQSIPSLVGIKCAGGDAGWYADMKPVIEQVSVFIPGHFMASGMAQGACGSYSNMACLNPTATVAWLRDISSNPDKGLDLEQRIGRFMSQAITPLLEQGYPGYAIDKLLASIGGWAAMTPRLMWPYKGVPEDEGPKVAELVRQIIPEFALDME